MSTKRLFIAINLPIKLKRELFEIQKNIDNQLDGFASQSFDEDGEIAEAKIFKWVEMENLHLTLKFLGQVGHNQIENIIKNIKQAIKNQKPFDLTTKEICYNTTKEIPKLIWLTTEKNKNLESLAKSFDEKIFLGHITLARVKEWAFKRIAMDERPSINQDLKFTIPVKSIELMESILKKTGPEYKIVKSFSL